MARTRTFGGVWKCSSCDKDAMTAAVQAAIDAEGPRLTSFTMGGYELLKPPETP